MRKLVGAIIGIVVSLALVAGFRLLAITLHPLPGMAVNDPQAMTTWLQGAPGFALVLYVAAWFIGALAGGWVALRIAHWAPAAWIVALVDLLLSSATLAQLTYPTWMKIGLLAAPLLGGWLAMRLPRPILPAGESIED